MADITVEAVNDKLAKGEVLTSEETKFVMSLPPDNAAAGNTATLEEEEKIEWPGEAEDANKDNETPEDKKAREDKEVADKKKTEADIIAAEAKKASGQEEPKLDIERLETELSKPEGQENLEGLTKREAAYFWSMRRDRRARQKAEEERDAALFREIQRKNQDAAAGKKADEAAEEDPLKDLRDKDQDDFMTVADAITILDKALKKPAPAADAGAGKAVNPVQMKYLEFCDKEARSTHQEDYDAVMELASELVNSNPEYVKEVGQAIAKGENPAEKTYQLIKQDPAFSKLFPAAEIRFKARKASQKQADKTPEELRKEQEAKAAEEALEKNKNKTKTTGHAGGESGAADESSKVDGYTVVDIMKMSDLAFAKLPKKTRDKFLQLYG